MTDHRTAVQEANAIYRRRSTLNTPEKRDEAIKVLAGHEVWSNANIHDITGASIWFIHLLAPKSAKTGGKINPETLEDIAEIIRQKDRGELDRSLFERVVDRGTSVYVLSRLSGYSITSTKRYAGRLKAREVA